MPIPSNVLVDSVFENCSRSCPFSLGKECTLLDLGNVLTDIFAFLAPFDQHNLRRTTSGVCRWYDSAAENGSLPFFVTIDGLNRWKHAPVNLFQGTAPSQKTIISLGQPTSRQKSIMSSLLESTQITLTVHVRNCCQDQSTSCYGDMTKQSLDEYTVIDRASLGSLAEVLFTHILVITGLFGMRSFGDMFCAGVSATAIEYRQADANQLKFVGSCWMSACQVLRCVNFPSFSVLEEVGPYWMSNCAGLERVTFADEYPKLKKVGSAWMAHCPTLKCVNLTVFTTLEEVGGNLAI